VGAWKNGKKDGIGELTYWSGAKFVGEWGANEVKKVGKFTYKNGDVYCGPFNDAGQKHTKPGSRAKHGYMNGQGGGR
jgi:hypothetical protein